MVQRIISFLLLLFIHAGALAQADTTASLQAALDAREHIRSLKEGVLLVRLQDREKGLSALRERGLTQMADEQEDELRAYNLDVIQAFKKGYSFCPVYFFFSGQSEFIRDQNWSRVEFLNDSLEVDTTIVFQRDKIHVAEFGRVQDESKGFPSEQKLKNTSSGAVMKKARYSNTVSGFPALLVKDDMIKQLKKPFPYYVKTYASVFFRRSKLRSVQLLQEKLEAFYRS